MSDITSSVTDVSESDSDELGSGNVRQRLRVSRDVLRTVLLLGLAGGLLLLFNLQADQLLLPYWLEDASRVLYKVYFLATLPFRGLVMVFSHRLDHHWTLSHHVVTCLGAPFFWWLVWRLSRVVKTRIAQRRRARVVPDVDAQALDRRQFLLRSTAGAVGVASGGLGSYATLVAPGILRTRRYEIAVRDLPPGLDGLRIAHVSDTHYGPFVSMGYLEKAMEIVNASHPDLVLFTGDHVHYTPKSIGPGIGVLAKARGRLGAVAVMGNHEHWEGAEACRAEFRATGIPLVDNGRLYLTTSGLCDTPSDDALCIAGVGDLWEDEVSFARALDGVPVGMPRVVLAHNPDVAESVDGEWRVDLMLSGHTHGGQIALPIVGAPVAPSRYGRKYLGGLCQGPICPVIVSRGVGVAGVPLRLGVPPEFGLITLKRA